MTNKSNNTPYWYKVPDLDDGGFTDLGYFFCTDFEYFYLSVYQYSGRWISKLVNIDGSISSEKYGKPAKTLKQAQKRALNLAKKDCNKLIKQLGYDYKLK
jgi:hypothetical protein